MQADAWLDGATTVRAGEEVDVAALERYLARRLPAARGPLVVEQFPRGYSNLTYLLRLGARELVLRRPPHGARASGGHDMAREFRVLQALSGAWAKAPEPLLFCDDESVLGAPFYVMQRVRGVILRSRPPAGMQLDAERMRRICTSLVDTLVELHAVDYRAAGLGDLGRPEGYVARQVGGWTQRYHRAQTDDIDAMDAAAAWLAAHLPPDGDAALIHNDYKYDNVVLDPSDPERIRAVLDWEMATAGDPLMDLGTTLGYWTEPGDPAPLRQFSLTSLPGNLNRRELVDRYAERSGRDTSGILFHYVYGLFKIGVIVQQIYWRYRSGHTRDERFASLVDAVRACGRSAERAIERDRIHDLY